MDSTNTLMAPQVRTKITLDSMLLLTSLKLFSPNTSSMLIIPRLLLSRSIMLLELLLQTQQQLWQNIDTLSQSSNPEPITILDRPLTLTLKITMLPTQQLVQLQLVFGQDPKLIHLLLVETSIFSLLVNL